ncbi:MAG TPA: CHRD domain-containing protein [Acidimicrobiia bacterium]|nr:CHRD domain-containing protein [Acidimicrobiia bacterium]
MRRLLTVLFTVAALIGVTAGTASADGHFAQAAFDAQLSGENEIPAVDSEGSGYASVTLSEDETSLDYRLYANGLDDITMAHIHVGAADENGPVAVFLFGPADPPVASDGLLAEGTITEADLIPTDGVFDGTMGQLVEMIRSGDTYVNVHTTANPSGEIRGQLQLASFNFSASLAGANEVPPVQTEGTGLATFSLNDSQTALDYTLLTYGLEGTTMAHIHVGPPGVNGPVVVFLFGPEMDGVTQDGLLAQGTITEGDLIPVTDVFDGTMETLIDRLRAGTAYVNVHTLANPSGEIRGQVNGLPRAVAGDTFTDDDASVHEGNIETIAAAGITRGCNPPDNDEYCPSDGFTRGQAAAFFNRALNLAASDTDVFVDDEDSIFEGDINAIAAIGITVGCNPPTNDEYCPDDTVTRAQWASFMVRALGLTEGGDTDRFTDDDGSVHEANINMIAEAGITLGCNPPDNDEFCPDDTVTRQQAASFFVRALGWRPVDS